MDHAVSENSESLRASASPRQGAPASGTYPEFFQEHRDFVVRYVQYKRVAYNADVDVFVDIGDVVQETMLAAYQEWAQVRTYQEPRNWLRRVANNKLIDQIRRSIKREDVDVPQDVLTEIAGMGGPSGLDRVLMSETIAEAFGRLSHPQREILQKTAAGFTVAEIARTMGMSAEAVRKHRARARQLIRRPRAEAPAPVNPPRQPVLSRRTHRALVASSGLTDTEVAERFPELTRVLGLKSRVDIELDLALARYSQVLRDRERALGADHPDTKSVRSVLARTLCRARRYDRAVPLLIEILTDREQLRGQVHPQTIAVCTDLAEAFAHTGRFEEAVGLYKRVLKYEAITLGAFHDRTVATRLVLARAIYGTGKRLSRATALFKQVLIQREHLLGRTHLDSVTVREELAQALLDDHKFKLAVPLITRTVETERRTLGYDHPRTVTTALKLAHVHREARQSGEAIALFEHVLTERERVLGRPHPDTMSVREDLGRMLLSDKQYARAAGVLVSVLRDNEQRFGREHRATRTIRRYLAQAYEGAHQYGLARQYYEQNLRYNMLSTVADRIEAYECHNDLVGVLLQCQSLDNAVERQMHVVQESQKLFGKHGLSSIKAVHRLETIRERQADEPALHNTRS